MSPQDRIAASRRYTKVIEVDIMRGRYRAAMSEGRAVARAEAGSVAGKLNADIEEVVMNPTTSSARIVFVGLHDTTHPFMH